MSGNLSGPPPPPHPPTHTHTHTQPPSHVALAFTGLPSLCACQKKHFGILSATAAQMLMASGAGTSEKRLLFSMQMKAAPLDGTAELSRKSLPACFTWMEPKGNLCVFFSSFWSHRLWFGKYDIENCHTCCEAPRMGAIVLLRLVKNKLNLRHLIFHDCG